jgi:hypothetical protein
MIEDWKFRAGAIAVSVTLGGALAFLVSTPTPTPPRVSCTPPAPCSSDGHISYPRLDPLAPAQP